MLHDGDPRWEGPPLPARLAEWYRLAALDLVEDGLRGKIGALGIELAADLKDRAHQLFSTFVNMRPLLPTRRVDHIRNNTHLRQRRPRAGSAIPSSIDLIQAQPLSSEAHAERLVPGLDNG